MDQTKSSIDQLIESKDSKSLVVNTLGTFEVYLENNHISRKTWGRDKTVQLFQFLLANHSRMALHKEKIIDRIWEDLGSDNIFKVALHGLNKVLNPDKKDRSESRFIIRQGQTYHLDMSNIWLDTDVFQAFIKIGHQCIQDQPQQAIRAYKHALKLYQGSFLPERVYEDWSSAERERLQLLAMTTYISLGKLILDDQPDEVIRMMEEALSIDPLWENAYRLKMQAFMINGNRPQAILTYQKCEDILENEFNVSPLPETKNLFKSIIGQT
jgi:two-component SAPR family response regulator